MVGVDDDMDLLEKVELKWWRRTKNTEKNQKAPFSPMTRELHVPMQTRRRDHYYKWRLYGSLYWNKMTGTRKGNVAIKKQMATILLRSQSTRSSSATIYCAIFHMWINGVDVEHKLLIELSLMPTGDHQGSSSCHWHVIQLYGFMDTLMELLPWQ